QMIRDCFLTNPHRVTVELHPDPSVGPQLAEDERRRIEQARAAMSPDDLQNVVIDTQELHRRQQMPDTPEALAAIPTLKRSDLDPKIKTIPTETLTAGKSRVLFHDLFTNGILYLDLGFDLHNLPAAYLPYVSLFSRALTETGTASESFVQLLQRIGRSTGGIRPSLFTSAVAGQEQGAAWLFLRGKAMIPQTGELLSILRDVLSSARLDNRERIRQMALEEKAGLESSLVDYGHRIVGSRIRAHFNEADWASEQMGGVDQLIFLRGLIERIDNDWPAVQEVFETLRSLLVNQNSLLANVTTDREAWQGIRPQLEDFLQAQPGEEITPALWESGLRPGDEGLTVPAQINFVGIGTHLYRAGYKLHGSILVIVPHLRSSYLWDRVRVLGGAYGAFCTFDRNSGVFSFLSYRDPNLVGTLEVYNQAADYLRNNMLDDAELTKAIIGAIGDLDSYQLPDAKGYTAMVRYLVGISDEERQRLRDQVLATTGEDFRALGETLAQALAKESVIVVLGSANAVQSANPLLDNRLAIRKLL
ncbi:MAG TPA: peptidase M16, partial [Anaerolineaceae bacterium]|nr:peptidase M16 [Anaerolineaceae bacterium]